MNINTKLQTRLQVIVCIFRDTMTFVYMHATRQYCTSLYSESYPILIAMPLSDWYVLEQFVLQFIIIDLTKNYA